jgi:CRISPR/Cas system-associated exonuclease Cas4 (RecB family)
MDSTSFTLTTNSVIRILEPAVIPRVSAIAHMGFCERAAFNISFFGMESNQYTANGEIGNAVHRITIKSILEIIDLSKRRIPIRKATGLHIFERNTEQDIGTNWKRFMLAGVENPLDLIKDDIDTRSDRILDELIDQEEENKLLLLRPEFTIRNIKIPLEGRLDLVKIKPVLLHKEKEDNFSYISSVELAGIGKEHVEIIQIKTGKSKTPTPTWNLQADAETLLLMETLNLKEPPKYTWQFADKDRHRRKFNFARVLESIDKYIRFWKSEIAPSITGYCPNCPLQEGCLTWAFAATSKLAENEIIKRKAEFDLSKRIRKEISYEDRWKLYVELRKPGERQQEGSAITNLTLDLSNINYVSQELTLIGDESFGQFLDFSIGDHVTISDGNPNLGSNPTGSIVDINLDKKSIRLRFYKGDLYYLILEGRERSTFTIDRFNFSDGMISMRFLDNFFRRSPYADVVLQYWNSIARQRRSIDGANGELSTHG